MNILVLIKCSLDVAEIKVDQQSSNLILEGVPLRLGDIDKNVVEAAVRLREKTDGKITAVSFGSLDTKELFRDALAMGLDELYLVENATNDRIDAGAVAHILEAALLKLAPFDLILCGFASDDGYSFQVGPRLSERLGLPLISYTRQLEVDGDSIIALQDQDGFQRHVRTTLPAIVSIAEEAFQPRRITLMEALKAKKKPVTIWRVQEDLGLVEADLFPGNSAELGMTRGVLISRKQQIIKGEKLGEIADQLINVLIEDGILSEGGNI